MRITHGEINANNPAIKYYVILVHNGYLYCNSHSLTNAPNSLMQAYAESAWRSSWARVISTDLNNEPISHSNTYSRRRYLNIYV